MVSIIPEASQILQQFRISQQSLAYKQKRLNRSDSLLVILLKCLHTAILAQALNYILFSHTDWHIFGQHQHSKIQWLCISLLDGASR